MIPKKIVLNVSSDSTSWPIPLAKLLPFLLSQLAPYCLESASEEKSGVSTNHFRVEALVCPLGHKHVTSPVQLDQMEITRTND